MQALLARLPLAWTASRRRRRLAVVAAGSLAAGTIAIAVQVHSPVGLVIGAILALAVLLVRTLTEPRFVRLEAAGLWPPIGSGDA